MFVLCEGRKYVNKHSIAVVSDAPGCYRKVEAASSGRFVNYLKYANGLETTAQFFMAHFLYWQFVSHVFKVVCIFYFLLYKVITEKFIFELWNCFVCLACESPSNSTLK